MVAGSNLPDALVERCCHMFLFLSAHGRYRVGYRRHLLEVKLGGRGERGRPTEHRRQSKLENSP